VQKILREGGTIMQNLEHQGGFSLIEGLIVVGVMSVIIALGGTMISKYSNNRSVDRVTKTISSTLQIVKLKSARHGLEYQAVLNYDETEKSLSIATQRGNSNRGSDNYVTEDSQTLNILSSITIAPASKTFNFNPNGTLGGASGSINIRPTDDARIKRCGKLIVTPFGRIRVVQGNWDGTSCDPIREP